MEKNSKIFVAGHNGFVGKNLYKKLVEYGYSNITIFEKKYLNLLDEKSTDEAIKNGEFDYIFVCAAICGGLKENMNNQYKFLYENLVIQNNIINACVKYQVKKILFLGSSCIFPKDYKQPLKEEYLLQAPLEETNEGYSIAKIAGLKLCEYANKEFDSNFISLMPCNLFGLGDDYNLETSHVLSAIVKKIVDAKESNKETVEMWGSGNPRREFLYVDDLADGMIWAIKNLNKTETFYNIGTGKDISIKELAYKIADIVGYKGTFSFDTSKPDGMLRKCLDISKIKNMGWEAKTSLDEGLKKTILDYKENHMS